MTGLGVNTAINSSDYTLAFLASDQILGVTTKGGGGHLKAMEGIEAEYRAQNPKGLFRTVDVIKDSFPPFIGTLAGKLLNSWDEAKKRGDIKAQEKILNGKIFGITRRRLGDLFFFIPVFIATFFRLLANKKITCIIDTQPIATSALIKAARLVNCLFHRHIKVVKVMTDLPTQEAVHFSASAKLLSKNDKKIYQLVASKPFRQKKGESEKEYKLRQELWWNEYFGLSLNKGEVVYRPFPIRPAFKKWKDIPVEQKPLSLQVKIFNDDEFAKISELLGSGERKKVPYGSNPSKTKEIVHIDIPQDAAVGLITIGSQAAFKTKDYVRNFIQIAKACGNQDKQHFLFVGCGLHEPGKKTLYSEVYDIVKNCRDLPDNVKIIPLNFQDDDELAPMMHRADFGVYGAGGLTSMEVNSVAKGKVFIHSEKELNRKELQTIDKEEIEKLILQGFALWEGGNAKYQIETIDASLAIPGNYFISQLLEAGIFSIAPTQEEELSVNSCPSPAHSLTQNEEADGVREKLPIFQPSHRKALSLS